MERSVNISSYPTLENCLFGAVKLKSMLMLICINFLNMVSDLIEKDFFSIGDEVRRNVIIFGVNMSLSPHNNKKKDISILGKGPRIRTYTGCRKIVFNEIY